MPSPQHLASSVESTTNAGKNPLTDPTHFSPLKRLGNSAIKVLTPTHTHTHKQLVVKTTHNLNLLRRTHTSQYCLPASKIPRIYIVTQQSIQQHQKHPNIFRENHSSYCYPTYPVNPYRCIQAFQRSFLHLTTTTPMIG